METKNLKLAANTCYLIGIFCAMLIFTGNTFSFYKVIRIAFYVSGALGLLFSLFQILQNKQDNSFLFWIGSLAIYLGFIGRIIHYPYANYLLITGIILSAISFIYDPFKSSNKNDDLIDQDETF